MTPIITITNAKTGVKAVVYTEIYLSTMRCLSSQPASELDTKISVSHDTFEHIVFVSNLLNNAIRGRMEITFSNP